MASLLFLSLSVTKLPAQWSPSPSPSQSASTRTTWPSWNRIHLSIHSSILFYPLPMPLLIDSFIIFSPRFRRRITPVANHRKNDSIASTVKIERLSFLGKICFTLKRFWLKLSCVQTSESSQPLVSFWSSCSPSGLRQFLLLGSPRPRGGQRLREGRRDCFLHVYPERECSQ